MEEFDVEKYREEGDKMAERIINKYRSQKAAKEKANQQEVLQKA